MAQEFRPSEWLAPEDWQEWVPCLNPRLTPQLHVA